MTAKTTQAENLKTLLFSVCLLFPQLLWAIAPPNAFAVSRDETHFRFFNVVRNELLPTLFGSSANGTGEASPGWDAGEGKPTLPRAVATLRYPQEWWCLCKTDENRTKDGLDGYGATFVDAEGLPITPTVLFEGSWNYGWVSREDGGCFMEALTNYPPRNNVPPSFQCRPQYITPGKEVLDNLNFPLVSDGTNRFLYDLRSQRKWPTDLGPDDILGANDSFAAKLPRGAVCVRKNGRWGMVDYSGAEILPCVHDEVRPLESRIVDVYAVKDGKSLGICRADGSWVLPVGNYAEFAPFRDGFYLDMIRVTTPDNLVGAVRMTDGAWVIPPEYEDVQTPGSTAAICRKKGLWGVVSFSGKQQTEFVFTSAENNYFPFGIWKVTLSDGSVRTVTELGTVCGENASFCTAGDVLLCIDGKRIFDAADPEHGIRLVEGATARFLGVSAATNVLLRTDKDGRCGIYDFTRRREVAPPVYKHVILAENMIRAADGERTDVFSLDGELLCSFSDHAVFPKSFSGEWYEWERKDFTFVDGIGPVLDGSRAGLIDTNGVLRLPMDYEDMGAYHEGVAPAKKDGLWGYVDLAGNWAIPPKYEAAWAFVNGHAAVRLEGKVGIITRADEVAAPFVYEEAGYVYKGMFPAKVGGKWGIFGLDGETKLPPEYACVEWIDIRDPRVPTRYHGKCRWRYE